MTDERLQALAMINSAIEAVGELAPDGLRGCTTALVAAGATGAAIVRWLHGHQAQVLVHSGGLGPKDVLAAVEAPDPGTVVVPVTTPQAERLALVATTADAATALLVHVAGQQLAMRLALLDTQRRLEEAHVRTETLMSATHALGRSLELRDVLAAILGQLRLVVPYDSASVQRLDGQVLEIIGGHGFDNPDEIIGLRFDLTADDNPNREVIGRRRTLTLADASSEYAAFREGPHLPGGIRSWLGVPLVFGDRLIGMLALDSREIGFYDEDHARIAGTFAAQAAVAIENARTYGEMRRLATQDALTGLHNRRHLEDVGEGMVELAAATGAPLAVLMCDLDHFKAINDTHGHVVGDDVLRAVADRIRDGIRPQDVLSRYGGEEFVVILPHTDATTAAAIAERLRRHIAEQPVTTAVGDLSLTVSIGMAGRGVEEASLERLLQQADRALYAAKGLGRNRVVAG